MLCPILLSQNCGTCNIPTHRVRWLPVVKSRRPFLSFGWIADLLVENNPTCMSPMIPLACLHAEPCLCSFNLLWLNSQWHALLKHCENVSWLGVRIQCALSCLYIIQKVSYNYCSCLVTRVVIWVNHIKLGNQHESLHKCQCYHKFDHICTCHHIMHIA